MGISRWIESGAEEVSIGNPLSRKTSIIWWFWGTHLGLERRDAVLPGGVGDVGQQDRRQTLAVEVVGDREGDLGAPGRRCDVADLAHDPVLEARLRGEAEALGVVEVGRPLDGALDVWGSREEPEGAGVRRQLLEEAAQVLAVLGPDGPDTDRRAVAENDIRSAVLGILGHGSASHGRVRG